MHNEQSAWQPPKKKSACRRDPAGGEGSCWFWWEGCPDGEKRGCYQLWFHRQRDAKRLQKTAETALGHTESPR